MNKEVIRVYEDEFEYAQTFSEVADSIITRVNDILKQQGYDIEFEIEEIDNE